MRVRCTYSGAKDSQLLVTLLLCVTFITISFTRVKTIHTSGQISTSQRHWWHCHRMKWNIFSKSKWWKLCCILVLFQIFCSPDIMTSITDPNTSVRFTGAMEEIHNKQLKTYGEIIDTTTELCQSHRQLVKSALGKFCINAPHWLTIYALFDLSNVK